MAAVFVEPPDIRELTRRSKALDAHVAEVAGVLHAANGRLVLAVAELLADERLGLGPGVHTPAQWVAWKVGLSPAHAADLVRVAQRIDELPDTVAALVAGRLSLDQATTIARYVPANYDTSASEVGRAMTVTQARRAFASYGYDADASPDPKPEPPERSVQSGRDAKGWWARLRLTPEEGATVERSWEAMRADLHRQAQRDLRAAIATGDASPDDKTPTTDLADGVVCAAEAALRAGEARFPGAARYLVHLHLEGGPDDTEPGVLSLHLGAALPRAVRRRLLCNSRLKSLFHRETGPIGVGRSTRTISDALARLVEHRDRGCAVPGCHSRHVEIHHIIHWEDGGHTETWNLVALCRHHHQAHHHGLLGVTGNPDLPHHHPDALRFTDWRNRPIDPSGRPVPPAPNLELIDAATTTTGITAATYTHPYGERLNHQDFWLQPNLPPRKPPADPPVDRPAAATPWDRPDVAASGHLGTDDPTVGTDPTRAGPTCA